MSKSPDAFRTISEVADWLDVPAHVLRFWESKFAQVKPLKRAGGRRYYRPADMALLGGIKSLLKDEGLTIKGVQKVLREKGVKHVAALSQTALDPEEVEADLTAAEGTVVDLADHRRGEPVAPAPAAEAPTEPEASPEPEAAAPSVDASREEPAEDATADADPAPADTPEAEEPPVEPAKVIDEPAAVTEPPAEPALPSWIRAAKKPEPETPAPEATAPESETPEPEDAAPEPEPPAPDPEPTPMGLFGSLPRLSDPKSSDQPGSPLTPAEPVQQTLDFGLPDLPPAQAEVIEEADPVNDSALVAATTTTPEPLGVDLPQSDPVPESYAPDATLLALATHLRRLTPAQRDAMEPALSTLSALSDRLNKVE